VCSRYTNWLTFENVGLDLFLSIGGALERRGAGGGVDRGGGGKVLKIVPSATADGYNSTHTTSAKANNTTLMPHSNVSPVSEQAGIEQEGDASVAACQASVLKWLPPAEDGEADKVSEKEAARLAIRRMLAWLPCQPDGSAGVGGESDPGDRSVSEQIPAGGLRVLLKEVAQVRQSTLASLEANPNECSLDTHVNTAPFETRPRKGTEISDNASLSATKSLGQQSVKKTARRDVVLFPSSRWEDCAQMIYDLGSLPKNQILQQEELEASYQRQAKEAIAEARRKKKLEEEAENARLQAILAAGLERKNKKESEEARLQEAKQLRMIEARADAADATRIRSLLTL